MNVSNNSAKGGTGGLGASESSSNSGSGGDGGSVHGIGVSTVNYNVTMTTVQANNNVGVAGGGGLGGTASIVHPDTSDGGNGGMGGSVVGGGIAFANNLKVSLTLNVQGGSASNNQLTAASGGGGGGAGTWGHDHILGGAGGAGGQALGGGIAIEADINAINSSSISNVTLVDNIVAAGGGGGGGPGSSATTGSAAGLFATGGDGGMAAGGSVYTSSLNTVTSSALTLTASVLAGNQLSAGNGSNGGTGTTPNGGPGGSGGNGGDALGGGIYNGDNTNLTAFDDTIGGLSADPLQPNINSNTLAAGSGGGGNNAGTPQGVASADGGSGGNAGNAEGGGVYIQSGTATFLSDTIVNNLALTIGLSGAGGSGAGGGSSGVRGIDGTGSGGGYFSDGGTSKVGNTILDLNDAVTSGADVSGVFSSLGHNLLGSTTGASGFVASDQVGITADQLNLGPLQNNGGSTATDALLHTDSNTSVAIDAGDNALVTTPPFANPATDQRGSATSSGPLMSAPSRSKPRTRLRSAPPPCQTASRARPITRPSPPRAASTRRA